MQEMSKVREVLGVTIRQRRKEMGFTLQKTSEKSGVSLGYLSQIEKGIGLPSIECLYKICSTLNLSMGELFHTLFPELNNA